MKPYINNSINIFILNLNLNKRNSEKMKKKNEPNKKSNNPIFKELLYTAKNSLANIIIPNKINPSEIIINKSVNEKLLLNIIENNSSPFKKTILSIIRICIIFQFERLFLVGGLSIN